MLDLTLTENPFSGTAMAKKKATTRKSSKRKSKKRKATRPKLAKKKKKKAKASRAASPIIVAPITIDGARWITWTQGGNEFTLKASTIGRMIENRRNASVEVVAAGGAVRIDTSAAMIIAAIES